MQYILIPNYSKVTFFSTENYADTQFQSANCVTKTFFNDDALI